MIILSYIFYSFAAIFILWEMLRLIGFSPSAVLTSLAAKAKAEGELNKKIDEAEVGDENHLGEKKYEATVGVSLFTLFILPFMFGQMIWMVFGLMTSQWFAFLFLIITSFIYGAVQKAVGVGTKADNVARFIDASLSIVVLFFILINRFQLGWTL